MSGILYKKSGVEKMSLITQKLDALLKADGFSLLETGCREHSGNSHDITVNRLEYMREEWEKVFIIAHEKPVGSSDDYLSTWAS